MENRNALSILNALLKENNTCAAALKTAASDVRELELSTVFRSLADESTKNARELSKEIKKLGGDPAAEKSGTKTSGFWDNLKAAVFGKDRDSILSNCETAEQRAQRSYRDAIASQNIPNDTRQVLRNQNAAVRTALETIRNYRQRAQYGWARGA